MTIRPPHPRIEQRQLKNEQEEKRLKKEEQEEKKLEKEKQREANNERKRKLNRERTQKYRKRKHMIAQPINKQTAKHILGLQEQINKQNEILTKLQDHLNQVFGEEGSIDEEDDTKDEEEGSIDEEDDDEEDDIKDDDYDSISQDTIEGEEPDFSDEEIPKERQTSRYVLE